MATPTSRPRRRTFFSSTRPRNIGSGPGCYRPSVGTSTPNTAKQRDAGLDILRIVGIAAVVVAHVWFREEWAHLYVFSWNMPLFFVIAGYLWSTRPLGEVVRRRTRMLFVPYAFWLVVWSTIFVIVTGDATLRFFAGQLLGGRYMYGKPFWAFWFSTALFVLVLLYWFMQKLPLPAQWAIALAALIPVYVFPEAVRAIPWAAGIGVSCLVFLVAGRTARRFEHLIATRARLWVGLALAVVGIALVGTGISQPVDLKLADFGTPFLSVAVAIVIVVGAMWVIRGVTSSFGIMSAPTVSLLAESTFMVTLTHAGILWATDPLGLPLFVQFLIALLVPWLAAVAVRHTVLSRALTGMPPRLVGAAA
jgi:acyltransferase